MNPNPLTNRPPRGRRPRVGLVASLLLDELGVICLLLCLPRWLFLGSAGFVVRQCLLSAAGTWATKIPVKQQPLFDSVPEQNSTSSLSFGNSGDFSALVNLPSILSKDLVYLTHSPFALLRISDKVGKGRRFAALIAPPFFHNSQPAVGRHNKIPTWIDQSSLLPLSQPGGCFRILHTTSLAGCLSREMRVRLIRQAKTRSARRSKL
jgi:hypothetical protein